MSEHYTPQPASGESPDPTIDAVGEHRLHPTFAVVQASRRWDKPAGLVSWAEHVTAWESYAKRFGYDQSAERINERGGFSYGELLDLLGSAPTTWRAREEMAGERRVP